MPIGVEIHVTNIAGSALPCRIDRGGIGYCAARIVFLNDEYDPANGVDRNLLVDFIEVDDVRYETEAPTTFSTGTWLPEDGLVAGFRESEVLHSSGYFQFFA